MARANVYTGASAPAPDLSKRQIRIGAQIELAKHTALEANARKHGRSLASELRLAVDHWLEAQRRITRRTESHV